MKDENYNSSPQSTNQKRPIRTYNSLEEADEGDAKEMAALSPETHLKNATLLTERVFAE